MRKNHLENRESLTFELLNARGASRFQNILKIDAAVPKEKRKKSAERPIVKVEFDLEKKGDFEIGETLPYKKHNFDQL